MMCTCTHDHTPACNQSVADVLGDGVLLKPLSLCVNRHQPTNFEHAISAPTSTSILYVNLYYYNDYNYETCHIHVHVHVIPTYLCSIIHVCHVVKDSYIVHT